MNEHKQRLGFRPEFKVVDHCSENCRMVEKHWIDHYRDAGYVLENVAYGQGVHALSDESRKKISEAFKGRPILWGAKLSEALRGVKKNWSTEGKKRVQANQFKKGHSRWASVPEESRERHRQASRDKWNDPEKRAKMSRRWQKMSDAEKATVIQQAESWRASRIDKQIEYTPKSKKRKNTIGGHRFTSTETNNFWSELRSDPAKYAAFIERRRRSTIETCKRKRELGIAQKPNLENSRKGGIAVFAKHPEHFKNAARKFWDEMRRNPEKYREYEVNRMAAMQAAAARKRDAS